MEYSEEIAYYEQKLAEARKVVADAKQERDSLKYRLRHMKQRQYCVEATKLIIQGCSQTELKQRLKGDVHQLQTVYAILRTAGINLPERNYSILNKIRKEKREYNENEKV